MCIWPHCEHWKGSESRFFAVGAAIALSPSFRGFKSSISQFRATAQRAYNPVEIPREICEDNALCVMPNLLANSVTVKPLAPKYFFRAVLSLFICSCVFIDYQVFTAKIVNIFGNRKFSICKYLNINYLQIISKYLSNYLQKVLLYQIIYLPLQC